MGLRRITEVGNLEFTVFQRNLDIRQEKAGIWKEHKEEV